MTTRPRLRRGAAALLTSFALALPSAAMIAGTTTVASAAAFPSGWVVKGESGSVGTSNSSPRVGETARVVVTRPAGSSWVVTGHQWLVDSVAVEGATAAEFTPRGEDEGKKIAVDVTVKTPNFANPSTYRHEFSPNVARGWLPDEISDQVTAAFTGRAAVGQRLSAVRPVVTQGTLAYVWQAVDGGAYPDGGTWESVRDLATGPTYTVPRELAGQRLRLRVSLQVPGYFQASDSVDVVVDTTLPVEVPKPADPIIFAAMKVKAPAKVKQGKSFTVMLSKVSGKVTVKASHLKKAKTAKVAKAKAKVKFTAPRLAKGKKSRTVTVKVVMKGERGNNQTRSVKVKVVR